MRNKLVVIGVDGATMDVISPLCEKGILPGFSEVLSNGVRGPLMSTFPPLTPPAWTSISTGVNPGKHGLFDFLRLEKDHSPSLNTSGQKHALDMWDYVPDLFTVCVNLPFTYPVKEINGIMVSGMQTPGIDSNCVFPKEIKQKILETAPGYEFDVVWSDYRGRKNTLVSKIMDMVSQRIRLFDYFYSMGSDLLFFVFTSTDRVQHVFWQEKPVEEVYKEIDHKIMQVVNDGNNLVIVSDHGFKGIKKLFFINSFLKEKGFLTLDNPGSNLKSRLGCLTKKALNTNYASYLTERTPEGLLNFARRKLIQGSLMDSIDWNNTDAIMLGHSGIYFNREGAFDRYSVSYENVERLTERVSEALLDYRDNGKKVVKSVEMNKDVFYGKFALSGPDLIPVLSDDYDLSPSYSQSIVDVSDFRTGGHHPRGVFMACGPDIGQGELGFASVCDVLPIILHVLGIAVPSHLDGIVPDGISIKKIGSGL
jgi:predicted AlkP superfamily phosphohydrolase/phosphomutase